MQNWRHAGRFGTDMIPLDTDGTTLTTGLLNLGTAGAPWANAYIATGGSIYVGGTAFEGGGGGSGIDVYEQQSHIEKIGYSYPLSNPQALSESFMDSSAMVVTLGRTHLLTETTIYLDRDAISISAIDTASATAWTPVLTGTTATNTTAGQSVDGTSVLYSVTATATTYYMAHSFSSFSLLDQDLKVWLYPDTVANITEARIKLQGNTSTVYAEWLIPIASITALTLNSLYINMDSADTTTANYNRGDIHRVFLGFLGTTTPQAVQWSWDKLRSVDNRPLKIPVQMVCDNGTNQEFINIASVTIAGDVYLLDTITTYSHTISSTEIKLKQLDIINGQGVIGSGTTGEAALTGWDISRQYFDTTTSGDLILTSRWYDESYQVATVTNASTTVLSVTTSSVADGFKSGDVVRLYKYEFIDQNYQSPYNASIGSNFLDLTLTADGTASSSDLTLVHGNTSNQNLGGDTASKWRGVRVSIDDFYQVEASTISQTLVKAIPNQFKPVNGFLIFKDTFDRTDSSTIGNGWSSITFTGTGTGWEINGNSIRMFAAAPAGNDYVSTIYRNLEGYAEKNIPLQITCEYTPKFTGAQARSYIGLFCGSDGTSYSTGTGFYIQTDTDVATTKIAVRSGGSDLITVDLGYKLTTEVKYNIKVQYYNDRIKIKIWPSGTAEKNAWDVNYFLTAGFSNDGDKLLLYGLSEYGSSTAVTYCDNIIITKGTPGFIQKSKVAVSGNKLIHGARLTRNDATNQNPIIYQKNAVIT